MLKIKIGQYIRTHFAFCALLNSILLALQLACIFAQSSSFSQSIPLPMHIYLEILGAGCLQIFLYLLLIGFQLLCLWGISQRVRLTSTQTYGGQTFIFFAANLLILSINSLFFPLSLFARITTNLLPSGLLPSVIIILGLFFAGLTLNALHALTSQSPRKRWWCTIFAIIVFPSALFIDYSAGIDKPFAQSQATQQKPNIILIGIDSLSPQAVNTQATPSIAHFLQGSVQFKDTISPLARTFPAWTTLLTGLYPLHHQARENLLPQHLVKSQASIVWEFQRHNYSTIFASDDRRFNNLDEDFGFQTIVGPKLGVNDVLLGAFYDFPLSNLLINFPLARVLFPYHYINRASHFVYYPTTFNQALKTALQQINPEKPLFLAVHFTLPHWPYAFATSSPAHNKQTYTQEESRALYYAAVHAVDSQVALLLKQLQEQGLLSNSLLVLLSDHGETLNEPGSRLTALKNYQGTGVSPLARYFKKYTDTTLETSGGHGSDLLSPGQFRCVLGVKIFHRGREITSAKTISTRVALIDIAPTIEEFMSFSTQQTSRHFDGISLLPTLLGKTPLKPRAFLLESGLLPNRAVSVKEAAFYAKLFYEINPKNYRLQLQSQKLKAINAMKLYGIIEQDWLLVLYPQKNNYLTVLLRLSDQQWTDDPRSSFAKNAPLPHLLKKLHTFYKGDLGDYPNTRYTKTTSHHPEKIPHGFIAKNY